MCPFRTHIMFFFQELKLQTIPYLAPIGRAHSLKTNNAITLTFPLIMT